MPSFAVTHTVKSRMVVRQDLGVPRQLYLDDTVVDLEGILVYALHFFSFAFFG